MIFTCRNYKRAGISMTVNAERAIRAIIVDDETTACRSLKLLLEQCGSNVIICGMARDTLNAQELLEHHKPDVLFLDIDMPNENGLEFMQRLGRYDFEVIFVTAYDEFAVGAFRLNAVDYILKPVNPRELSNAVKRLQERLLFREFSHRHPVSYADLQQQISQGAVRQRIVLRDGANIEVLQFKAIVYVEGSGSYSRIVFIRDGHERSVTMGYPIADYEKLLPANMFFRIHKSFLVNRLYIEKLTKQEQHFVILKNAHSLPVSRRRHNDLLAFLSDHNSLT
jgi:two-component system LytT family response regulator